MPVRSSLTVEDWRRLNRLLEQALEIAPVERSGWIDALPSESTHLRPLLIELLEQSRGTGFATGIDPHTTVARLASEALSAMRREQPGDRIGPWQLERLLAEGGMGTVWVAQRADGVMQRTAALKLPRAEWIDHGLTERIARERVILAMLQHPHIAVLYDAGVTESGRPYLALEYVVGQPIDVYCESSAVSLTDVLRLVVQVVRAVAYAHSRLVIHRDLKPSNVLVTNDGMPKLLDFGISKLIGGDALTGDATALTRLAGRPLTPAYAAPEQVLGLPISVAADVYALGIMLFELTTGTRLYSASTPRALEEEIMRGDLRRPSDVAENKTRARALRGDLDAIILTALRRQPEERYQSAAMLADDLERYLLGEPVRAQPDRRSYRLRKFVVRNKLPVAAGSAIVLALGIGLGVALWQADVAREQAQRATAMNTFVLSLIQQADPNASQQTKAADLAMLAAIERRIDTEFKGSPDQLVQLRVSVGDAYRNRGELAAARRVFKRATDDAALQLPADNLALLRARVRAADFNLIVSLDSVADLGSIIERLRPMGRDGADLLIDAFLIREQLAGRFHIPAMQTRAEGRNQLVEAYEVATRHFGEGSRQQLKVASRHAWLIAKLKEPGEDGRPDALLLLEHVLGHARQRTDFNASSVEYLDALGSYGFWLCASGRSAEGLRISWDVAAVVRESHGASSLQLELPLAFIGNCLRGMGDKSAVGFLIDAYQVAAAREKPPTSNLMRRAEAAFITLVEERRLGKAQEFLDIAMKNSESFADDGLRKKFIYRLQPSRVRMLAWLGETVQAESLATGVVAELEAVRPMRMTPQEITLWLGLSFAQRENGRFDEAIRTAATLEEFCRQQNWIGCLIEAPAARARAELESGETASALATVERALNLEKNLFEDPLDADLGVVVGRIFLANGRAAESVEPLRQAYGFWLGHDPKSVWAAEAEYWFGRAYLANGDPKRGRWMVAEAQDALATSKLKSHRALASNSEAR